MRHNIGAMSLATRVRSTVANPTVDALFVVLAASVLLDFSTTTVIFLSPAYEEANELLTSLADVHVALALAYNLGYGAVLVAAYSLVGGWLGRVGATIAFTSAVLGVNNLVYFALGDPSLVVAAFGDAVPVVVRYGIPVFGFVGGTVWHVARGGSMPWRLVGATLAAGLLLDAVVVGLL